MSPRPVLPLVLLVALAAAGCRFPRGGAAAPLHADDPPGRWHVAKEGETWAQIAARAGVPLEDLLEINGLPPGARLDPGQLVYVLESPAGEARWEEPAASVTPATTAMVWPLREPRVTSPFGHRLGRPHEGIDLAAPTGTPIVAAREGYVLYAGDGVRGYGNMVVLQHGGDLLTVYAHNSVVLVRTGDRVVQGQEIARVGQSGRATAPHLHFEVRQGEHPRDPLTYLPPLR